MSSVSDSLEKLPCCIGFFREALADSERSGSKVVCPFDF